LTEVWTEVVSNVVSVMMDDGLTLTDSQESNLELLSQGTLNTLIFSLQGQGGNSAINGLMGNE